MWGQLFKSTPYPLKRISLRFLLKFVFDNWDLKSDSYQYVLKLKTTYYLCFFSLPRGIPLRFLFWSCVLKLKLKIILISIVLKIKPRLLSYTSNSPLERGWGVFSYSNIKLYSHHISISFKICSSLNLKQQSQFVHSVFLHSILFIDFQNSWE
jgi:hypothetical protein